MKWNDRIVKVEKKRVGDILPTETNPRVHGKIQNERLTAVLDEYGKAGVLLSYIGEDGKERLFDGHARQGLNPDEEWHVALTDLTPQEARSLVLFYDPIAGMAEWDRVQVAGLLEQTAVTNDVLADMLSELSADFGLAVGGEEGDGDADPQVDRANELREEWGTAVGQVWRIGEHLLTCGDCTDPETVAKVMIGNPHLMVTDPPYGVNYDANWRNDALRADGTALGARAVGVVHNDDRSDWREAWALFSGDVAYVWHAGIHGASVQESLEFAGFDIRSQIVWAKNNIVIGRGHYHPKHESCFYAVRNGKTGHWNGDRKQNTLWEIDKPLKSETGHSTQKPLECMARPIRNNSQRGDVIYEPFCGSGTTMVACENLGRICRAVELSPEYVAVILQRMSEAFPDIEITKMDG